MRTKNVWLGAILLTCLSVWPAFGQEEPPRPLPERYDSAPTPLSELPPPQSPDLFPAPPEISSWRRYSRPDCCGPIGGNGSVEMEIYTREGVSLPVSGRLLPHALNPGVFVEAGGRTLFFNPAQDAAWTADLSLSNIYNNGNRPNLTFVMLNPPQLFNIREYNRTLVNATVGREWYIMGPTVNPGVSWRAGLDLGGSWGTSRLSLNHLLPETPNDFWRRGDVIGAFLISAHTDIEIPFGSARLYTGFRTEWSYTWSDALLGQNCDIEEVNFLFTLGLRY